MPQRKRHSRKDTGAGGSPVNAGVSPAKKGARRRPADAALEDLVARFGFALVLMREGRILYANPAAERLAGRKRGDLTGRSLEDLIHPDSIVPPDLKGEAPTLGADAGPDAARSTPALPLCECRILTGDGRDRWAEVSTSVITYEGRRSVLVSLVDVTEHKRARAAVREGEDLLRNVFDAIRDGISVLDKDLNIVRVNRTMELWYKDSLPLIGKKCYEAYHDRPCPCVPCPTLRAFQDKKLQMEEVARAGHGPGGWLELYAFPLLDASGEVTGVVEYSRDITTRKKIDLKRERAESELRAREEELLEVNAQLARARDQALAASRAKSAFLASMSHELRTPLNAIIGFSQIVLRKTAGQMPEKQTQNLETILGSANHLLEMINDLLDLSKIEAGRMDVACEVFDLGEVVREAAKTVEPLMESNANRFRADLAPDLPPLYSDRTRVRQILLNLLSNAAKFTKEGRVNLTAKMEIGRTARGKKEAFVSIEVADTGIGMTDEELTEIFQEFKQGDLSTTQRYAGTGLGLSIARNLARLLGGEIRAQSAPGKGSTFTVDLPVRLRLGKAKAG